MTKTTTTKASKASTKASKAKAAKTPEQLTAIFEQAKAAADIIRKERTAAVLEAAKAKTEDEQAAAKVKLDDVNARLTAAEAAENKARAAATPAEVQEAPIKPLTSYEIAKEAAAASAPVQIDLTIAPSRKEQRAAAKEAAKAAAPADIKTLYEVLKTAAFGFSFTKSLYQIDKEWIDDEAEAAYIHIKVSFEYLQFLAIQYKKAAILCGDTAKASGKAVKAAKEAKNKLFDYLKTIKAEAGIDSKCSAHDPEFLAAAAARFTYRSEYLKDGVKYAPATLSRFIIDVFKYLDSGIEGIDTAAELCDKRYKKDTKM